MGELSKPIMTPVGVAYRSLYDTVEVAMKSSKWAQKLFGGLAPVTASELHIIGPGKLGKYEATVQTVMPPGAQCIQARKNADTTWFQTPELAYVLYDALETPIVFYFHKRDLFLKPGSKPPIYGYGEISLDQV